MRSSLWQASQRQGRGGAWPVVLTERSRNQSKITKKSFWILSSWLLLGTGKLGGGRRLGRRRDKFAAVQSWRRGEQEDELVMCPSRGAAAVVHGEMLQGTSCSTSPSCLHRRRQHPQPPATGGLRNLLLPVIFLSSSSSSSSLSMHSL
jgi:hypothetical protein